MNYIPVRLRGASRRGRTTLAMLSVLALALCGLAAAAGPASAANCSGISCVGRDPYVNSCTASSSKTGSFTINGDTATIVNEYSKVCNSNWVIGYLNTSAKNAGWQIYLTLTTTDSDRQPESLCFPGELPIANTDGSFTQPCANYYAGATGWPAWTNMVDGTNFTYGIINAYNSAGAYEGYAKANQ